MKEILGAAVWSLVCIFISQTCAIADSPGATGASDPHSLSPQQSEKIDQMIKALEEQKRKLEPLAEVKGKFERAQDVTDKANTSLFRLLLAAKMSCDLDETCPKTDKEQMARDVERARTEMPKEQIQASLDEMLKTCNAEMRCSPQERRWIETEREKVK